MFVGLADKLSRVWPWLNKPKLEGKSGEYLSYITSSYPSNHTYKITRQGELKPKHKLAARYQKIRKLLPARVTSLAEIGCSKGFFVFSASVMPHCSRSLGIDVSHYDIEVCRWVKETLRNKNTSFEILQLHELTPRISEFGSAFQTVLLLNTYQYLYFGSDAFPMCYGDHDAIFRHLREICSGRIIFNNRIALEDCQNVERISQASKACQMNYSEEKALEAASKYFTVTRHGKIGKYPLLTLDVK